MVTQTAHYLFSVAQGTKPGLDYLTYIQLDTHTHIHTHTHTHTGTPGRSPLNERPDRRRVRYLHTTQQAQDTGTCTNSGIRTSGSVNREAADLSHRDRLQLTTRVGTLIVATIYLQLIQNRYMFRSFTVLQCSHQHCVQTVASDVEVVGYL